MGAKGTGLVVAALTALGLLAGGALWQTAALRAAYRDGVAAGRADAEAEGRRAVADQMRRGQAAAQAARDDAARMEESHALMQRRLEELIDDMDAAAARQGGVARECLAPGIVRRLDAIGRHGGASADPAGGADPPLRAAR